MRTISRDELIRRMAGGGTTLVNVLPAGAFATGHIPGSVNLPVDEIATRGPGMLPDRAADIVVHCGGPT